MKIRSGFVSNSSSSSFVIAKSFLTEEQAADMKALYNKMSYDKVTNEEADTKDFDGRDYIYDENGNYFEESKYYITFNAYNTPKKWSTFIAKLKLPEGALICSHEG